MISVFRYYKKYHRPSSWKYISVFCRYSLVIYSIQIFGKTMSSTRCFFRANIAQKSFWILLSSMAVLPSLASNDDNAKGLISHGELYDPVRYPYVVSLVMWVPDGVVYCTGSLISPLFVLTAAHCTDRVEANDIQVSRYDKTIR